MLLLAGSFTQHMLGESRLRSKDNLKISGLKSLFYIDVKHINNYLVDHVKSDNAEDNLKCLNDLLQQFEQNYTAATRTGFSYKFISPLNRLFEFKTANDSLYCGDRGFELIIYLDNLTLGNIHKPKSKRYRIENVVHNIALKHARDCQNHYLEAFKSILSSPNVSNYSIHNYWIHFADKFIHHLKSKGYYNYQEGIHTTRTRESGAIVHKALCEMCESLYDKRCVHLSKTDKGRINWQELFALYQDYIVSPARDYVYHFASVFEVIIYEAGLVEDKTIFDWNENSLFMNSLAVYQLSRILPDEGGYLMKELIRVIK